MPPLLASPGPFGHRLALVFTRGTGIFQPDLRILLRAGNCFLRELGSVGFGIVKDCLALALGVGAYGDGLLLGIAEKLLGSILSLLDFAEYI